jgi:hypothetical protein
MATNRQLLRCGFRLGVVLLLLSVCSSCALLLFHWAPRDRNGNGPRDVAKAFVEAVQSNDFATAASFWNPSSIGNAESNFQMKFEEFCVRTFKCDTYKLSMTGRQKSYFKVGFRGLRNGHEMRWGLYFKRVEGEWRIVEDLWIPDQKQTEAPK